MTTAGDVRDYLGAISLHGDPALELKRAAALSEASAGALTYIKPIVRQEDIPALLSGAGLGVLCCEAHAETVSSAGAAAIVVENPRLSFIRSVDRFFSPPRPAPGVHPSAVVSPASTIAPDASVGAFCFVGPDCVVGSGSILHPHVTLYGNVRIGSDVVVHSGTVIGADGFGYERNEEGVLEKFPHIGGVIIEDDVEIGSNTSIDRGTLSNTRIQSGAKIDNQVHISHNVVIGRHAAVIAQSMVGGSARVGDYGWLAPSAVIMNQAQIGERSTVGLAAVVVKGVPDNETVMGSPAVPAEEFRRTRAAIKKLLSE